MYNHLKTHDIHSRLQKRPNASWCGAVIEKNEGQILSSTQALQHSWNSQNTLKKSPCNSAVWYISCVQTEYLKVDTGIKTCYSITTAFLNASIKHVEECRHMKATRVWIPKIIRGWGADWKLKKVWAALQLLLLISYGKCAFFPPFK